MKELLDEAADMELLRLESTEQQLKYKVWSKCMLAQDLIMRNKRIFPKKHRTIEVGTNRIVLNTCT